MTNFSYVLKYIEIPARSIYNFSGPYDIPTGDRNDAGMKMIDQWNCACGFYDRLESSIKSDGLRSPICINAGAILPRWQCRLPGSFDLATTPICVDAGGSRLYVAQKLDMTIPCIVCDYTNMFPDAKVIDSDDELRSYFRDEIIETAYTEWGVRVSVPHVHLLDEHRDQFDDLTRRIRLREFEHCVPQVHTDRVVVGQNSETISEPAIEQIVETIPDVSVSERIPDLTDIAAVTGSEPTKRKSRRKKVDVVEPSTTETVIHATIEPDVDTDQLVNVEVEPEVCPVSEPIPDVVVTEQVAVKPKLKKTRKKRR